MNFSVVIVSFYSCHLVENLVKKLSNQINIFIVENSRDIQFKKLIESKYKNIEVIIPDTNLGWGSAINLGIKKSSSEFVLCINPDIKIYDGTFNSLSNCIEKFKDFSIISPTYLNDKIYKNYDIFSLKENPRNEVVNKYGIKEVDHVDGQFIIINKKKFSEIGYFDENIFLFFETNDLCARIRNLNQKIYVCDNIKYDHLGQQSSDLSILEEPKLLRNWHYLWSKFYYYRKHYNYFLAFRKTFPNLVRAIKNSFLSIIFFNKDKLISHSYELRGLISAYFLRKSFLRPKIKLNNK